MRWLHTYISMVGLGALLFFSATGLTLNHPDWMLGGRRRERTLTGRLDPGLFGSSGADARPVDKLAIVEQLRRTDHVRRLVDDFRLEETECSIAFHAPGGTADVLIQRQTGEYRISIVEEGWVALLNDLHKGRHSGPVWSVLIDVTAAALALVAVSGVWLLVYVRRRCATGFWVGMAGTVVLWVIFRLGVH